MEKLDRIPGEATRNRRMRRRLDPQLEGTRMPVTILPASRADLRKKRLPTIYCDLGFAEARKSSALLAVPAGAISNPSKWRWKTCQFGEIKSLIETWTKELRMGETIRLVIEAPLSVRFTDLDTGDPTAREIETELKSGTKKISPYWYVGAGAQTHLAAIHLIQRLRTLKGVKRILLAEGFVTGKGSAKSPTTRYKACQKCAERDWRSTSSDKSSNGTIASRHLTDVHILHRILRRDTDVGEIVRSNDNRLKHCESILQYIPGSRAKDASPVPPVLLWKA
jgi:hypothetical protein